MRTLITLGCLFLLAACSSSDGDTTIVIDLCDQKECNDGFLCDSDTGECFCDDSSCGEGMRCVADGQRCVDDPAQACAVGEIVDDGECRCDPETCDGPDIGCSDDGARCQWQGDGTCASATADWDGATALFEDVSDAAGLADLDVQGIRLSTADLSGNGAPDLMVRKGLAEADDFSDGGERYFWLLENQGDATFQDITQASGLLQTRYGDDPDLGRPSEVVAVGDIDNSGHLDVVTLSSDAGSEGAEVMRGQGDGTFELGPVSEPLHAAGQATTRGGLTLTDIDRSGHLDLWIGTGSPAQDLLLQGAGDATFQDITDERQLTTEPWNDVHTLNEARGHSNAWSTNACDLDLTGHPSLLAASYGRAPNHLWHPQAEGDLILFDNRSIDSGYAFDHRQDWSDNESARCYCQHNRDAPDCEDIPEPEYIACASDDDAFRWNQANDREPFRLGGNSGTTLCADLNNNGFLDLLTAEIVHWDVGDSSDPTEILYNTGQSPPRFERPGPAATGLERPRDGVVFDDGDITAAALDIDNSGRLDLLIASTDYPGTRAHLFMQQPDQTFHYVPIELGIDHTSAHGIAVADFNQNGALDVALGHSRARCSAGDHCRDEPHIRLFENQVGTQNNWIQLRLQGDGQATNRAAIGAQVTVITDDHRQLSEVDGGHGHYGMQHDLTQHFGLGDACQATVIIDWPDADRSRQVHRLAAGQRYLIEQGEAPTVD